MPSFAHQTAGSIVLRSLLSFLPFVFYLQPSCAQSGNQAQVGKTTLIELFTSEGCSSCPSAEALLPALRNRNVFVLEFHVDYWDRLGWKDPFSDAAFSARQRNYAQHFRLTSIYTPQAVVNGISETVGSDRNAILKSILSVQADGGTRDNAALSLTAKQHAEKITAIYTVNARNPDQEKATTVINIALVQLNAMSKPGAGENRGRVLKHVNIVRELKTEKTSSGSIEFAIPGGAKADELGITAWVQEAGNGAIYTVTTAAVSP